MRPTYRPRRTPSVRAVLARTDHIPGFVFLAAAAEDFVPLLLLLLLVFEEEGMFCIRVLTMSRGWVKHAAMEAATPPRKKGYGGGCCSVAEGWLVDVIGGVGCEDGDVDEVDGIDRDDDDIGAGDSMLPDADAGADAGAAGDCMTMAPGAA